jgi:hypothetical protein
VFVDRQDGLGIVIASLSKRADITRDFQGFFAHARTARTIVQWPRPPELREANTKMA